jgi:hypothetical protein
MIMSINQAKSPFLSHLYLIIKGKHSVKSKVILRKIFGMFIRVSICNGAVSMTDYAGLAGQNGWKG